MTSSNHATISRNSIAQAILAGEQGRKDRIEQAAYEREMQRLGRISEAPGRAADILSGLTEAIAHAVAAADENPQSFVVMWVQPHEYDGDVERNMGLGYRGPQQGIPDQLQLAARQVYGALADLEPELLYRSKDGLLSGKGQLAIVLRLS